MLPVTAMSCGLELEPVENWRSTVKVAWSMTVTFAAERLTMKIFPLAARITGSPEAAPWRRSFVTVRDGRAIPARVPTLLV